MNMLLSAILKFRTSKKSFQIFISISFLNTLNALLCKKYVGIYASKIIEIVFCLELINFLNSECRKWGHYSICGENVSKLPV